MGAVLANTSIASHRTEGSIALSKFVECNFKRIYSVAFGLTGNDFGAEALVMRAIDEAKKSKDQFHTRKYPFIWLCQLTLDAAVEGLHWYGIQEVKRNSLLAMSKLSSEDRLLFYLKFVADASIAQISFWMDAEPTSVVERLASTSVQLKTAFHEAEKAADKPGWGRSTLDTVIGYAVRHHVVSPAWLARLHI